LGTFRWTYDDDNIKTAITGTVRDALGVDHNLYTLVLDPTTGGYVFTMIGEIPGSVLDLSPAEVIKAGSPDNPILEIGAAQNTDFIRMTADSTVGTGNINESHGFVGVDNGNLDTGETMFFTLHHLGGSQFNFSSISIGTKAPASTYHVVANLVGGGTYVQDLALGKNEPITVDPPGNAMIISVEITKTGGASTKIGIGDIHVTIAPTDVQLGFAVELKDGDNDTTTANFVVDIDADNDGDWDSNVNALSAPVTTLSQKTVGIDDSGMHLSMASAYDGDHVQRDYLVL
jgi:hypothetical protein